MAGVLEDAHGLRKNPQAPEHERRIQRHRRERITGQPVRLAVTSASRDDGDARSIRAERVAEISGIDDRAVAGQLVGRIWLYGMLWHVGHPPASKRQVFGWQAKRNTA